MWFGNIVSITWWNDVWLKEGVARFCEFKMMEILRPESNSWNNWIIDVYKVALSKDEKLAKTHALRSPTPDAKDLSDIFDPIAYAKGGIICRMMEQFAGKDVFFKVLRAYIYRFYFRNADTEDFLDTANPIVTSKELTAELNDTQAKELMTISDYIKPWIDQACYPIVTVSETIEEAESGYKYYQLHQKPIDAACNDMTWPIYMEWIDTEGQTGELLWKEKSIKVKLPTTNPVWFNHNMIGFFKLQYHSKYLDKLAQNS